MSITGGDSNLMISVSKIDSAKVRAVFKSHNNSSTLGIWNLSVSGFLLTHLKSTTNRISPDFFKMENSGAAYGDRLFLMIASLVNLSISVWHNFIRWYAIGYGFHGQVCCQSEESGTQRLLPIPQLGLALDDFLVENLDWEVELRLFFPRVRRQPWLREF